MSSKSQLLYGCVAYGATVLCDASPSAASAQEVKSFLNESLALVDHSKDAKSTLEKGNYQASYISVEQRDSLPEGLTYMCVATKQFERRLQFAFLQEAQKKFEAKYTQSEDSTIATALPYGLQEFGRTTLQPLFDKYGSGSGDAIKAAQAEIGNVRGIMVENINRVLERGEHIDNLVDRTGQMTASSREFRMRSRGLRRRMWWKNVKVMILLGVVVIFLVYLFVGFGCGLPGWQKCVGGGGKKE